MLTEKAVRLIVNELQKDKRKLDLLLRWIGGRVDSEMEIIIGRSLQYSSNLFSLWPDSKDEVQRRKWGFYVAAVDLKKRCPSNAQYLARRDQERQERRGRSPFAGWSTAARVESDFEIAAAMAADGMTYAQIAAELVRRNPKKYYRHKPSPDVVRKTLKKLGFQKKNATH